MLITWAMQRQQTANKQSKYYCMSKTSGVHANSYTHCGAREFVGPKHVKDALILHYAACHLSTTSGLEYSLKAYKLHFSTFKLISFPYYISLILNYKPIFNKFQSKCLSKVNEQLLKWIRCPREASALAPSHPQSPPPKKSREILYVRGIGNLTDYFILFYTR